jgi:hypothetical protein
MRLWASSGAEDERDHHRTGEASSRDSTAWTVMPQDSRRAEQGGLLPSEGMHDHVPTHEGDNAEADRPWSLSMLTAHAGTAHRRLGDACGA